MNPGSNAYGAPSNHRSVQKHGHTLIIQRDIEDIVMSFGSRIF